MRTNQTIKSDARDARNAAIHEAERLEAAIAKAEANPDKKIYRTNAIKAAERTEAYIEAAEKLEAEAAEVKKLEAEAAERRLEAVMDAELEALAVGLKAEAARKAAKFEAAREAAKAEAEKRHSIVGAEVAEAINAELLKVIDKAAQDAGVDLITDECACGGAYIDTAIMVSTNVYGKNRVVWALPLTLHHSRIVPADIYGTKPTDEDAAKWYVLADMDKVRKGTQYVYTDESGKKPVITRVRADRQGNPIKVKMSLNKYFTEHIHDVIKTAIYRHEHKDDVNWLSNGLKSKRYRVFLGTPLSVS